MPSKLYSRVQSNLNFLLQQSYQSQYDFLCALNLNLDSWESVPDIAIYPKVELGYSSDEVQVTSSPLCAMVIDSPLHIFDERIDKARSYFSYGVQSTWLVIPGLRTSAYFQILKSTPCLG